VLRHLRTPNHPDLLVGTDTADDAAVWRRPGGRALIATVDFFTPIVDDARTWGAIAAANAASDVYAMGGRPLFALNIVAWPRERLPLDLLGEVMAGGEETAATGGWLVVGGHTVDGEEPMYGQAVIGEADEADVWANTGGRDGQALVLTKALGTGVVATAVKREPAGAVAADGPLGTAYPAAVASMTRLNAEAADVARTAGATAATDITGFGLVGHLGKLAAASGVGARVQLEALPLLDGVRPLLAAGFVPGGTGRNLDNVAGRLRWASPAAEASWSALVADPQTSGGLLFCCPAERADAAVTALRSSGHAAARIGYLDAGLPAGELQLG
jgi:selenide, water dikinase